MLRAELSRRWSTSNSLPFSRSCIRFNSARSPITIETVTGPDHSHRHTPPTDVIGRLMGSLLSEASNAPSLEPLWHRTALASFPHYRQIRCIVSEIVHRK